MRHIGISEEQLIDLTNSVACAKCPDSVVWREYYLSMENVVKAKVSETQQLKDIQGNVQRLLRQNQEITQKFENLERENNARSRSEYMSFRIDRNKEKINEINDEIMHDMQRMIVLQDKLRVDGEKDLKNDVDWFYQTPTFDRLTYNSQVGSKQGKARRSYIGLLSDRSTQTKAQPAEEVQVQRPVKTRTPLRSPSNSSKDSSHKDSSNSSSDTDKSSTTDNSKLRRSSVEETAKNKTETVRTSNRTPVHFNNNGKEEEMDMYFGKDGDYSSKSLRNFIERYKVVKEINIAGRMQGWDKPDFRADKLKMALQGDPYSYVSFESSMNQSWTRHDEKIISKLKDRYMSIQAVELSILQFEQRSQGSQESYYDFMNHLRQMVSEAYDGDLQIELNRKVAWKFVSGIHNDEIRVKVMEAGWMQSRKEAKPLQDLLKIAEATRTSDYRRSIDNGRIR